MLPKPALVTGLLLVAAVLAFAGLAFQQVPMSTTQTLTQQSTDTWVSYSSYATVNIVTHTTTGLPSSYVGWELLCFGTLPCVTMEVTYKCDYVACNVVTQTTESYYVTQNVATISYSQTATSSITKSSTSLVPASAALGLTDDAFTTLAVIVIGVLALLTAYIMMKSRTMHKES